LFQYLQPAVFLKFKIRKQVNLNQEALLPTQRHELMARLAQPIQYDIAVVGGGATGLGVALDAAARGFSVVLVDSHDFAKGTSSRATKLLHGGVRYLAQGDIALVREALHERTTLLHNAPHIAQPLPFIMPSYKWWEKPFYGAGLMIYDVLAGKAGLGKTEFLNHAQTLACLPVARTEGLRGSVKYWDGQFNDARLALALARTAATYGALLVNYCRALRLRYDGDKLSGLDVSDSETGKTYEIKSRCIINATGVWVDELRQLDGQTVPSKSGRPVKPMVAPSQGVHIVVDREFLKSDHALMVPKTADGRVLFAVPWLGKVILGTTDTPRYDLAREPLAFEEEIDFILNESARYLTRGPKRSDVKSIWVGLRPLVKPPDEDGESTKKLSREHTILVSRSGLVTVTGGKWTTYRAMAEDVLERCFDASLLQRNAIAKGDESGLTSHMRLIGGSSEGDGVARLSISAAPGAHSYGSEQIQLQAMDGANIVLTEGLTAAMVRFAVRFEYARTVEDVLARRSRLLFLDAKLAKSVATEVAALMQDEGVIDAKLAAFNKLADQYVCPPKP
jgi:glycerol-3-phosphate dehydrogenase